ncbi:calcium:proton antiporter [Corynebacterium sp. AOP40-9SA-29]|uniref:calcium:proton antiporter n=1 Tax=Corynebacterium sp. AOP40-9SA-29 TaxID=3457677 RepID=UPI0040332AA9
MTSASALRETLTTSVVARLILGWGTFLATLLAGPVLDGDLSTPVLTAILLGLVGVIVVCAFGVVAQAEHLAHRLGDPYGTLVLTLSIVVIEVILISAVMLGPGEHTTIARDSVMAVSMIILNLVIGVALLVGGTRHGDLTPNRTGTSSYLALLVVLTTMAFVMPGLIGSDGSYTTGQAVTIALLTVVLYGYFLYRQTGAQAADFREVTAETTAQTTTQDAPAPRADGAASASAGHRPEIIARSIILLLTVLPIVLLSHDMATLLDEGLARAGAPVALSGVLIAMIVFLPETITAVRAAHTGEIQRVSNLCHGALVSTVGLTIPAVLIIGMATGQHVELFESPTNLVLLAVTLLLSVASFTGRLVTAIHGAAHLMLFLVFALSVFS